MVDAIGLLHAVKIVAGFYTVQYEQSKRGVVGCACVLFHISSGIFLPRIG